MDRKLASIQVIKKLEPIEGADTIEKATILGWECVVKKGDFKVGDLAVYCEVDSILPERPEFEFLRHRKFKIRTIRMRGQISQGIAFPLNILDGILSEDEIKNLTVGQDVSERLGVRKYEPEIPVQLSGIARGLFPDFLVKSDETRVQIIQPILDKYAGTKCVITEKADGSSITYFVKDGEFRVCSRNLELKEDENNIIWKHANESGLKQRMLAYGRNIALQGEIIGPGLQKNRYQLERIKVLFFNAFDIDEHRFLGHHELKKICSDLLLETVPILDENFILISDIAGLIEMASGTSTLNPRIQREGIVIRSIEEIQDQELIRHTGGRLSFKVINPAYLLKYEE